MFLPLHIFEPRYREMVADALASDRLIGMALLRPGWEPDYEGRPPVYPIGCSGVITHVEQLPDGRYNIVLRGLERFRIVEEDSAKRTAAPRSSRSSTPLKPTIVRRAKRVPSWRRCSRRRSRRAQRTSEAASDLRTAAAMCDEDLVNALAQDLDLEPLERQALLEHDSLRARAESLVELLEMKLLIARTPGLSNVAH